MEESQAVLAQAMRLAHEALWKDLDELKNSLRCSSRELPEVLRARLGATYFDTVEHFRLEEQGGYLGGVRQREPNWERTVQQLAAEHQQLKQSLEALIDRAQAASMDDQLRSDVKEWIARVRQHEARENDLVQDAFNLDLGAED